MRVTLTYQHDDNGSVTFHRYCRDAEQACSIADKIGSVCGSAVERDENFIYVSVSDDRLKEAIAEIEGDGFYVMEG
jgi:hypothetical protein